jgi:hypothetical protein
MLLKCLWVFYILCTWSYTFLKKIKRRLNLGHTCYHAVQNLLYVYIISKNLQIKISRTLPVVLYGYEIWPIILRKEHRLRPFENAVLRRIFGPKREEVMGDWRRLHEECHNFYVSPNITRVIKSRSTRYTWHVACMEEMRDTYKILGGNPQGKKLCGRCRLS